MIDFENKDGGVILNIGKTRSGKSMATKYMILKNAHVFNFGIVFVSTKFNSGYNFLPDQYVFEEYRPEILENYIRLLENYREEYGKPPPKNFVIFDDMVGLLNGNDPFLNHIHTRLRHTSTFLFHNVQYIKGGGINPTIRENVEYVLMFNSKTKNTLNALYENFGQEFENYKSFKKHILKHTEKHTGILYIQDEPDIRNNYVKWRCPDMSKYNIKLNYT